MTSTSAARPLRFGIIGAGSIADYHVNGLRAAGGAEIAAIAARSPASAQKAAQRLDIPQSVDHWRSLLALDTIDAIIIATPDDTHCEIACAALEAGVHVMLQKPMALTVSDCQAILAAAHGARGLLGISFMHRYFPEVSAAQRLLMDPARPFGAILSARLRNATPGADWDDWFYSRARTGGGVVMQIGVHGIDLVQHLFGTVSHVSAQTALRLPRRRLKDGRIVAPDVEDHAFAVYTMASGVLVSHEMCYAEVAGTDRFTMEIVCERGVLHLRGPRAPLAVRRVDDAAWSLPELPKEPLGVQQHRAFLAMLRRETAPDGTAEAALAGMRVVEAIYRSADTGAAVSLAAPTREEAS